ncbi:MAG: hypothetical protein QXX68_03165 [Candidatus Pacearchaeota archaeon]
MAKSIDSLERNVFMSFHHAKRDIYQLRSSIEELNKKIQHITLNQAALLEKLSQIERNRKTKKK